MTLLPWRAAAAVQQQQRDCPAPVYAYLVDKINYPSFLCDRLSMSNARDQAPPPVRLDASAQNDDPLPSWFSQFLDDRQTRKPSAHTMKAYRQDFIAVATLITGGDPVQLAVTDITKDSMRTAFAAYARDHEAASIRRCWSTWNVLCTFLYTGELLTANPMQLVGRPKLAKPLPKALPRRAVEALLETVAQDRDSRRQTDWTERDLALILTALLAGLRADELRQGDVGDIRTTDDGAAVIHVKGKGGTERSVPIEAELLAVIEAYLDSRAIRFPSGTKPGRHTRVTGLDLPDPEIRLGR